MKIMSQSESFEFDNVTPEAVDCCVEHGAAKLSGFIDDEAFKTLQNRGFPKSYERAEQTHPKLAQLLRVFQPGGLPGVEVESTEQFKTDIITVPDFRAPERIDWHRDSMPRIGVTLLIPIRGGPARFEFRDDIHANPKFVYYQQGDVLMIRQHIETYNGQNVDKPQIEHRGIANERRDLYAIDLQYKHLEAEFTI